MLIIPRKLRGPESLCTVVPGSTFLATADYSQRPLHSVAVSTHDGDQSLACQGWTTLRRIETEAGRRPDRVYQAFDCTLLLLVCIYGGHVSGGNLLP